MAPPGNFGATPESRAFVKIRSGLTQARGMVADISSGGIEIEMHSTAGMHFGASIELHSDKIGYIDGMVSWVKPRRIGIAFARTSNNAAKVTAFLKNFSAH